jgi:hypothetical protein
MSVGQDPGALNALRQGYLPYNLLVHTYSNLSFRAVAQQDQYIPGSEVKLFASLREYDVPVEGRASVWAEITLPEKNSRIVTLSETAPGEFQGSFFTTISGLYDIRVRARGETFYRSAFTREQNLSAYAFQSRDGLRGEPGLPPGRGENANNEGDILCALLECLRHGDVMTPKFYELLSSYGLNLQALIDCLTKHCDERNGRNIAATLERRQPASKRGSSPEDALLQLIKQLKADDLRAMLTGLLHDNS